jgi:hypothetical protein
MRTNSVPYSDQPPGASPDNTRVGNFNKDDSVANGYDDGYAVTGSTSFSISLNYMTDVGAYSSSPSYYGAFDLGGNVSEWNEGIVVSGLTYRSIRGGGFSSTSLGLAASNRSFDNPKGVNITYGFRVATLAAPVLGDFNTDGVVDARDYIVLRKDNHPLNDYTDWRAHFGNTAGSGASIATAVPEPSSAVLLLAGLVGVSLVASTRW